VCSSDLPKTPKPHENERRLSVMNKRTGIQLLRLV